MIFQRAGIDPWSRIEQCRVERVDGERCRNKARKNDVGIARCWRHRDGVSS